MTGTLTGYMVYRLQAAVKRTTETDLPYSVLVDALEETLNQLSHDMADGEFIELPNGRTLTAGTLH